MYRLQPGFRRGDSVVYAIHVPTLDIVKIGCTTWLTRRMHAHRETFAAFVLLGLVIGAGREVEAGFHRELAAYQVPQLRVAGWMPRGPREHFRATAEVLAFVRSNFVPVVA